MRSSLVAVIAATGIAGIGLYYVKEVMKSDTDRVADAVRAELSKEKRVIQSKVGFVRKNANELHGFAMFKIGLREYVKACVATRASRRAPYEYSCY
jgi:hypothetical protein